jgi:hypothetical protein
VDEDVATAGEEGKSGAVDFADVEGF